MTSCFVNEVEWWRGGCFGFIAKLRKSVNCEEFNEIDICFGCKLSKIRISDYARGNTKTFRTIIHVPAQNLSRIIMQILRLFDQ
jgi:hypothetical protein